MKHFLTLKDLSSKQIEQIVSLAIKIKKEYKVGILKNYMSNKNLAMIFNKSSTRTRVSFEVGINQLGGSALFLNANDLQINRGESVADTARVISSMADMIMMRTYKQADLEEFAKYSSVPVINGLTDDNHPIQVLSDYMSIKEFFDDTKDLKIAYIGDGNNMARSWVNLSRRVGFKITLATPNGYEVEQSFLDDALSGGTKLGITNDPRVAIKDADIVVTDTWVSMGEEKERQKKLKAFAGFTIDSKLFSLASSRARVFHCLPVYRGYEISKELFEKHSDEIFLQAENRLHLQKGLMVFLNDLYEQNKRGDE